MIITFDTQKDSAAAMQAVLDAIVAGTGGAVSETKDPASTEERPSEKPKQRKVMKAEAPAATATTEAPAATATTETFVTPEPVIIEPVKNDDGIPAAGPTADELVAKAKAWYIQDGKKDQAKFDKVKSMLASLGASKFQECADLVKAGEELDNLIGGHADKAEPVKTESPYPTDISGLRAYLHPHSKSGDPLQPKVIALLSDFTGKEKSNLGDLKKEDYEGFCKAFDVMKGKAAADL